MLGTPKTTKIPNLILGTQTKNKKKTNLMLGTLKKNCILTPTIQPHQKIRL